MNANDYNTIVQLIKLGHEDAAKDFAKSSARAKNTTARKASGKVLSISSNTVPLAIAPLLAKKEANGVVQFVAKATGERATIDFGSRKYHCGVKDGYKVADLMSVAQIKNDNDERADTKVDGVFISSTLRYFYENCERI